MDVLYEIISSVKSLWPIRFWDVLDIILLSYIIYKFIGLMRETRAGGLFKGVNIVLVGYFIASSLDIRAVSFLLKNTIDVGIFSIIVIFNPEIRRTLEKIGHSKISKIPVFSQEVPPEDATRWGTAIDAICDACEDLSATTTGALIVIEMDTKLGEQIDTGTILNATPSKEIFGNIFYPKTPLHDGAVIMRDGIILAAACFLPKPQNEERINKELGSRHRAAIGMSENSDAVVIVVSEETGVISVAENGELTRRLTRDDLKKLLRDRIIANKLPKTTQKQTDTQRERKALFRRKNK